MCNRVDDSQGRQSLTLWVFRGCQILIIWLAGPAANHKVSLFDIVAALGTVNNVESFKNK